MSPSHRSLPWPETASVLPVEPLRPVIERLEALAVRHADDVSLRAPLVDEDGERDAAADPPPALEQVLEAFGGIEPVAGGGVDLLVDERLDLGPYTLLGDATAFYPLHEGEDVAVILTIDADGAPGAVYGIGEDLSLTLASRDLGGFLTRYADALEASLAALGDDTGREREESLDARMRENLWEAVLGVRAEDDAPELAGGARTEGAGRAEIAILPAARASLEPPVDLPAGTVGVADLRRAPLDASVPVMDAELPGDPLATRLGWTAGGLVVCLIEDGTPMGTDDMDDMDDMDEVDA